MFIDSDTMIAPKNRRTDPAVSAPAPRTEASPREAETERREALARTIRRTSEQLNEGDPENFGWQAGCTI